MSKKYTIIVDQRAWGLLNGPLEVSQNTLSNQHVALASIHIELADMQNRLAYLQNCL